MTGLYIASTTRGAGKSLLTFSLGLLLQKSGRRVGYLKPVGALPQKKDERVGDADALVVQEVLGQFAPADVLTPVMLPDSLHALALLAPRRPEPQGGRTALERIEGSYRKLSDGKDITLVSGVGIFPATGRCRHADGLSLIRRLGLKVLLIERIHTRFSSDALLLTKDLLGQDLLGVVLNAVPEDMMRDVTTVLAPFLRANDIPVYGIIPHVPELQAMRVSELADGLAGYIVAGNAHAAGLVHGFVIGTMQVDNFMVFLRRHPQSAVIVGGDRADLQLAALHANCPCIILTGNLAPSELIRARAEDMGVPLIAVRADTYAVARSMARILKSKKLRELSQIRLACQMVEELVDSRAIHNDLGKG